MLTPFRPDKLWLLQEFFMEMDVMPNSQEVDVQFDDVTGEVIFPKVAGKTGVVEVIG